MPTKSALARVSLRDLALMADLDATRTVGSLTTDDRAALKSFGMLLLY